MVQPAGAFNGSGYFPLMAKGGFNLFEVGHITTSRGIAAACNKDPAFSDEVIQAFNRYLQEDWGDLGEDDKRMNDSAAKNNNDRILARYDLSKGGVYIITEWDRSYTTILFCDEY